MKLPRYAIENHQFTIVIICLFVLAGTVSMLTMPRSEDPPVTPAGSSVVAVYPGANPSDVEQLIVEPIEEALNGLEDIRYLTSNSMDNIGIVDVEFESGCDPDEKYTEVVQTVNSIRDQLPENLMSLEMPKWSIANVAIFQLALISDSAEFSEMEYEAERLKDNLEKIKGIKEAELVAVPEQEIRIAVDLPKLAMYHIPLNQVIGSIQDANTNIPGGYLDMGDKRFSIKTSGSYQTLEDIRNTVIHSVQGKPVFLRDAAEVRFDTEDNTHLARVNGRRAVFLKLTQKKNTNIITISRDVKEEVKRFRKRLPLNMELEIVFDQSQSVVKRFSGFFNSMLYGLILVGLVIFSAVGFRASVIVMLVIPISLLIGIGLTDISGFGLEQMTIAGLVIALGMLVDNAIVVTENISRFMKMGCSRIEAAVKGTSQVGWAVASSTMTTVFAFIPIIMMQGMTGEFIRGMPVTVVFTLIISLLLSLTFTPYLSEKLFVQSKKSWEQPMRRLMNHVIRTYYLKILTAWLNRPLRYLLMTGAVFLLAYALFPVVGVSLFPKAEKPMFYVNVNFPPDTNIDRTDAAVRQIESELNALPGVNRILSNVGAGNPALYYNMFPERNKSYHGQLVVFLDKYQYKPFQKMLADLRSSLGRIPGVQIEVKELEQGPPVEAPIAIRVLGEDLEMLRHLSHDVETVIQSEKAVVNVRNPMSTTKSDLKISISKDKAGMYGVPLTEISRTIRAAVAGLPVTEYRDSNGKRYDIVLRMPFRDKPVLSDLDRIYVTSLAGAHMPLGQLATVRLMASPLEIQHYQLDRSVTLTADVLQSGSVAKVTRKILKKLNEYPWPKGYSFYVAGEQESREDSFGGMGRAALIALIAIFGILVLQFRSYSQTLIVFSAIPLAIIGSIVALLLSGCTFSFTAFIGVTSLVGIVVNNSIVLVDYTNQLRREGKSLIEAIKESGQTRFIPIMLTSLTTVGGLIPLTIGGGTMWAPMGWTIIGGLLTSTFLTLVVVPVLYKIFTPQLDNKNESE